VSAARYLLDTGIVSAPMARRPNAKVIRQLERLGARCAIGAPIWHELIYGCARLPGGARRAALEDYLSSVVERSFQVLPYDELAAAWHGRERARLEEAGRPAPFVDGQIAAIAVTQGLTLVTANTRHFREFADLETVDWTR
jgi:tRNA(fMet)-specific endonuclease VapC